jgi:hypothetical protein
MFGPLRKQGSFSMNNSPLIDLDLIDKIVLCIPDWAWDPVCQVLVPAIVDEMSGFVLEKLTGRYDDFDRAEEILFDHYKPLEQKHALIIDCFKLISPHVTVDLLDSLNLDQLQPNKTDEVPIM